MLVDAQNSHILPLTLTFQGPIKSIATSSQGAMRVSLSGGKPYPLPESFIMNDGDNVSLRYTLDGHGLSVPLLGETSSQRLLTLIM
eukprot:10843328-Ditylum_brightwellii.AAC.1